MAKFCTQCGNELDEKAVMCPKCGTSTGTQVITKESKSNGMAVAGFVLSLIFPLQIFGLIFSIIGLNKSKSTNSGRGLSIAGIIISIIFIIHVIMVITITSDIINTAKQKSYENSLMVIEEYATKQYELCQLGIEDYDKDVFSENNCELQYNYSDSLIKNAGYNTDDINYVEITIFNSYRIEITAAADGTGKFEGAKFSK